MNSEALQALDQKSYKSNENENDEVPIPIEEVSYVDDYASYREHNDSIGAELEAQPYNNLQSSRAHQRANSVLKEKIDNSLYIDSNQTHLIDDLQTVDSSSVMESTDPSVV